MREFPEVEVAGVAAAEGGGGGGQGELDRLAVRQAAAAVAHPDGVQQLGELLALPGVANTALVTPNNKQRMRI